MIEELQKKLDNIKNQLEEQIKQIADLRQLEDLRIQFLGRKSELVEFLKGLKDLTEGERKKIGPAANDLRQKIEALIEEKKSTFREQAIKKMLEADRIDITAPSKKILKGHFHPLTLMRRKIEEVFESLGFEIVEGPEAEKEYYNFDALNIPADHPAREMQDTFWINQDEAKQVKSGQRLLMRTQTSSVQIRYMEKAKPPFRIVSIGRVFRYEATDQTHDIQFHQVEGLMIGKDVSLTNLKGILEVLFKKIFGNDVEIRFRPSYFPFVEPGVEVDMKFRGKWLEIGGAGMVHPNVLKEVGISANKWQGFAFGMGLERLAMIKYEIDDIRLFSSGDMRFIKQF